MFVNLTDRRAGLADKTGVNALGQEKGKLQIAVEDAGRGIPLETRDRVTKCFARGSEAARKVEGAGLGLALLAPLQLRTVEN